MRLASQDAPTILRHGELPHLGEQDAVLLSLGRREIVDGRDRHRPAALGRESLEAGEPAAVLVRGFLLLAEEAPEQRLPLRPPQPLPEPQIGMGGVPQPGEPLHRFRAQRHRTPPPPNYTNSRSEDGAPSEPAEMFRPAARLRPWPRSRRSFLFAVPAPEPTASPSTHAVIAGARHQPCAVGAERELMHVTGVAPQFGDQAETSSCPRIES